MHTEKEYQYFLVLHGRYYPQFDTTQHWAKVPSQELSDALVEAFKERLKD